MQQPKPASLQHAISQRILIQLGLIVGILLMSMFAFSRGRPIYFVGIVALPVMVYFINHPPVLFASVIALFNSMLTFPGIPQGLNAYHVAAAGMIGLIVASLIITKKTYRGPRYLSDKFLLFFTLIILMVMTVHGSGLRALGSSMWGGMAYIQLFIGMGYLIASRYIVLTEKQWKYTVAALVLLTAVPAVAQVVFVLSGGAIYQHYMFVKAEIGALAYSLYTHEAAQGVPRYQMLGNLALAVFSLAMVFMPLRKSGMVFFVLTMIGVFVLAGYAGYRNVLFRIVLTLILFFLLIEPRKRPIRVAIMIGLGFVGWLSLIPVSGSLPLPFQRMISWIPGMSISPVILYDTAFSNEWRFQIWDMVLHDLPQYLWVGRGFVMPASLATLTSETMGDSVLMAYLYHNYHSGPLSLLMDLGILGFIGYTGFLIFAILEMYRAFRRLAPGTFLHRAFAFFFAHFVVFVLMFYFVFGDVKSSSMHFFIYLSILRGIILTSRQQKAGQSVSESSPDRTPGALPHPIRA